MTLFDDDLLMLEIDSGFKDLSVGVGSDKINLDLVAGPIVNLQTVFVVITNAKYMVAVGLLAMCGFLSGL
jgi:hypothetical protein